VDKLKKRLANDVFPVDRKLFAVDKKWIDGAPMKIQKTIGQAGEYGEASFNQ
jgi:hypothetical protein